MLLTVIVARFAEDQRMREVVVVELLRKRAAGVLPPTMQTLAQVVLLQRVSNLGWPLYSQYIP
jgi:hypothetical protein